MRTLKLFLIFLVVIATLTGCGNSPGVSKSQLVLGTLVKVEIFDRDLSFAKKRAVLDEVFRRMDEIDSRMSKFRKDSELSRLNKSPEGAETTISPDLFEVIKKSLYISKKSKGAFDITIGPLMRLWEPSELAKRDLPSDPEIARLRKRVGWQNVKIDDANGTVTFTKPGMEIDLGGIAKGFAVDKAVEILKNNGVKEAIINAGGEVACIGRKAGGERWRIGIRDPNNKEKTLATIFISDQVVATSGHYENYAVISKKRYSHIVDPRTGRPVHNRIASVTVLASDAKTADAWATALCVLGEKEGLEAANAISDIKAIFIQEDGSILTTKNLNRDEFKPETK